MNARSIGGIFALAGLVVSGPGGAQEIINLPGEDRHLELGFEELYTVGLVSGEDWEQFGNVRTVGFDGAGQLYIFDNVADRITVMRPNGEFVRAFGDGPGEFRNPDGLAVMRDGRVVIADIGHRVYHLFDANGESERRVRMASEPGELTATELLSDPGGQAVFSAVGSQTFAVLFGVPVRTIPHTTRPVERIVLTAAVATKDTVTEGWLPDGDPSSFVPVGNQRTLGLPSDFWSAHAGGRAPRWKRGVFGLVDTVKIARPGEGVGES